MNRTILSKYWAKIVYFSWNEAISSDEFDICNLLDELSCSIGDMFPIEKPKISGVPEAGSARSDRMMAFGEKSKDDLCIGGIGLSGPHVGENREQLVVLQ